MALPGNSQAFRTCEQNDCRSRAIVSQSTKRGKEGNPRTDVVKGHAVSGWAQDCSWKAYHKRPQNAGLLGSPLWGRLTSHKDAPSFCRHRFHPDSRVHTIQPSTAEFICLPDRSPSRSFFLLSAEIAVWRLEGITVSPAVGLDWGGADLPVGSPSWGGGAWTQAQ